MPLLMQTIIALSRLPIHAFLGSSIIFYFCGPIMARTLKHLLPRSVLAFKFEDALTVLSTVSATAALLTSIIIFCASVSWYLSKQSNYHKAGGLRSLIVYILTFWIIFVGAITVLTAILFFAWGGLAIFARLTSGGLDSRLIFILLLPMLMLLIAIWAGFLLIFAIVRSAVCLPTAFTHTPLNIIQIWQSKSANDSDLVFATAIIFALILGLNIATALGAPEWVIAQSAMGVFLFTLALLQTASETLMETSKPSPRK
ncbi:MULTISPECIES: hypothetical protein [Rhodobacterales]|uniref:hypothetical protein n=1 Tax=Rhodobacterales TaxID=204455 RepID=UPI003298A2DB